MNSKNNMHNNQKQTWICLHQNLIIQQHSTAKKCITESHLHINYIMFPENDAL